MKPVVNQNIRYTFWEDLRIVTEAKKWRPCLGRSPSCKQKVFGEKDSRLCTPCREMNLRAEYGSPNAKGVDESYKKTDGRGKYQRTLKRPFDRAEDCGDR